MTTPAPPSNGDTVALIGLVSTTLLRKGEVKNFIWSPFYAAFVMQGYAQLYAGTGPVQSASFYVRTVNGERPDPAGNIDVEGGGGGVTNPAVAAVIAEPGATRNAVDARAKAVGDNLYAPFQNFVVAPLSAGATGAANRSALQNTITAAATSGVDVFMPAGTFPIAGTINVASTVRIFGAGKNRTRLQQLTKPSPIFYVTGENVTMEDFYGVGAGLDMTGLNVTVFQDYNVVRVENTAHGFTARRIGGKDIYITILVRPYPNPFNGVTTPTRLKRFVIQDIEGDGVWSALHGGPFDDPFIDGVRGKCVRATSTDTDADGPPHLVYLNTVLPTGGTYTDEFFTRGGTVDNLVAWDGPDFIGAAFSFKHMRGTQFGKLSARSWRGIAELLSLTDCYLGSLTSTDDKYPATGGGSERASVSFSDCVRTTVGKASIAFANVDHGRAVRFENPSSDCRIDVLDVVDNSTTDRSTGTTMFDIYVQGVRNTLGQVTLSNKGAARYAGIIFASTGNGGRALDPRIGVGYLYCVRVNAAHQGVVIDYDPLRSSISRSLSGAAVLSIESGANPTIRDRGVGQVLPTGFVDEIERGVTVTGLAATDNGKTWQYKDTGGWEVQNDRVDYVGAAGRSLAVVDGGKADGTLRCTIADLGTGFGDGLAFRVVDNNNYLGLMFSGTPADGRLNLHKRIAGTRTSVASPAAGVVVASNAVIEVVMSGTSISVKANGTEVIGPQTVTELATATLHGLLGTADGAGVKTGRIEFV